MCLTSYLASSARQEDTVSGVWLTIYDIGWFRHRAMSSQGLFTHGSYGYVNITLFEGKHDFLADMHRTDFWRRRNIALLIEFPTQFDGIA